MLTFQPWCILAMFQNIGQQWPVPLFTVGFGSQFSRHHNQPFVLFRNAIVQFLDFPALKTLQSKCHQRPVLHILTKLCLLSSVGMHWCRSNQTLKLLCSKFARFASQTYSSVYCIGPSLSGIFQYYVLSLVILRCISFCTAWSQWSSLFCIYCSVHRSFFEDSTYCIAGPGILYTFIQLCCIWPSLSVYCIATTASIVYSPLVMLT